MQQQAEIHVKDSIFLSEKQTLVPGGAIVRNPSPLQPAKLSTNIGKVKGNAHLSQPKSSLFSDLSSVNNSSNMETLGVKLSAKTAHLADDVSLSRITR